MDEEGLRASLIFKAVRDQARVIAQETCRLSLPADSPDLDLGKLPEEMKQLLDVGIAAGITASFRFMRLVEEEELDREV